jgi:prepilin-type processing-associated H-X9-DG protein
VDQSRLFKNWAIEILPFIEEQPLADQFTFNNKGPKAADLITLRSKANAIPRGTEIGVMLCPSDNGRGSPFMESNGSVYARGNYGYNAFQFWPNEWVWLFFIGSPKSSQKDLQPFYNYNVGMGGFDDTMHRMVLNISKITDGTSKTIAIAELRVGLSERDRRGVWSMGMCGSNLHCRHAGNSINGCVEDDDILGSANIIADVGNSRLREECMHVSTFDGSGQSMVRSRHPGGANVAMADSSVQFLSDFIDQGEVYVDGAIDNEPDAKDTLESDFRTWQRLNMSRDSFTINDAL